MSAVVVDPCLGQSGWISNESSIGVKKISRYFLSHASQSVVYRGSIRSLNMDVVKSGGDPELLVDLVTESITEIFSDAFDTVEVYVRHTIEEDNKVRLYLNLTFGSRVQSILKYSIMDTLESPLLMQWLSGDWVGIVRPD